MNQYIKQSVIALVFDSELEIDRLGKAAKYARTTEQKALDVIRDYVYDLRAAALGPIPPARGAVQIRRAA